MAEQKEQQSRELDPVRENNQNGGGYNKPLND